MCLLKALTSINKIFHQILLQFLNRYLFIYNAETLVYTFFIFLYLQNDFSLLCNMDSQIKPICLYIKLSLSRFLSSIKGQSLCRMSLAKFVAAAKSLQSCPTLCDPIDDSPGGSTVPGILQARTLEWVAISFSNVWKWKVKVKSLSRFQLLVTPWSAAYQAPPSLGFSRQEYWSPGVR